MLFITHIKNNSKDLLIAFAIICALKFIVFLFLGTTVEIDTYNYAFNALNFEYPPLFPYLLRLGFLFSNNFLIIIFFQILIFSLCASAFAVYFSENKKQIFILSVLQGLEPVSGFFCTDIMSEVIFISTLFVWTILVHKFFSEAKFNFWVAGLIGVICGILYLERFAGIVFLTLFFAIAFFTTQHKKKILLTFLLSIIGFQFTILPVRLKYKQVFNTYRINGISGAMLWNNASVLYPNSKIKQSLNSDFANFVFSSDQSQFNERNSIKGRQLNDFTMIYRAYLVKNKVAQQDAIYISDKAGEMAMELIKESPVQYLTKYVWPNFAQYFFEDDGINATSYSDRLKEKYNIGNVNFQVNYSRFIYMTPFLLVLSATFLYWKGRRGLLARIILISSWSYLFILPFICILSIRLVLVIMPLLVFLLYLQIRGNSANT